MDRAVERRLAAILLTDVVGYSRMISKDETGTLRRLKALRRAVIEPQVAAAHGRVVKSTGDGVLVEFHSSVRAVGCAVAIQRAAAAQNAGLPEDQAMRMRIGINLGDVVPEPDGDLYGDGVNVAARLEPLAEPGGLCISRSIHDQVRDKLPYRFEDRGELELKNIARPIGVFALSAEAIAASTDPPEDEPDQTVLTSAAPERRRRLWPLLAAAVLCFAATGSAAWWFWPAKAPIADRTLAVQAGLPPKPLPPLSLVVLPFANLSSDPEQAFFADGLTEDLTTDLSHLAGSFVIARNTAFTYKGKPVDVRQLGRDLGVRYVLEGSVRRAGEQVVVNAQLISTETGAHIWADRFEGERSRLGALQVEFVARLARSLDVQLTEAESLRSLRERPNNPDASDLAMRGWATLNKPRTKATFDEAVSLFERALAVEPDLMQGQLGLSRSLILRAGVRWSSDLNEDVRRAKDLIDRFLSHNPQNALGRTTQGEVFRVMRRFDEASSALRSATEIDPNLAVAHAQAGMVKILSGHAADAPALVENAMRLSPRDPLMTAWKFYICHAYSHQARWAEAVDWCNRSAADGPYWLTMVDLAVANAWLGNDAAAHAAVARLLDLMPGYTVQKWANAGWSDNPKFMEEYAFLIDGLRKAGLPEGITKNN